jgi:putative oxidoreductase
MPQVVPAEVGDAWLFSDKGGGWEYPAFWTAVLLALFLIGTVVVVLLASPPLGRLS